MPSLSALRARVVALPGTSRLREALSVPAAEVVVTATATVDGEPVTTTVRAPHPAASCG